MSTNAKKIAELNDILRATMLPIYGRTVITQGVSDLEPLKLKALVIAVQRFNEFTPDNDPYKEHDFGKVILDGEDYFWKIDYYDKTMEGRSPDPSDPNVTTRVLTIMRADEY